MKRIYGSFVVVLVLIGGLGCNAVSQVLSPSATAPAPPSAVPTQAPSPSATSAPPTAAPSPTAATSTAAPTEAPAATATSEATATAAGPAVPTVNPTMLAQMGPMAYMMLGISAYDHPVGTPAAAFNGIPIMTGAIAGQQYNDESYSYTAAATLKEATAFYTKLAAKLGFQPGGTGFGGTGAAAFHNVNFIDFKSQSDIYIMSKDADPNHVLVVIFKAP